MSDLKAELKRRNLPTSGSKYVLSERLIKSNNSNKTKLRPVAPAESKESSPDIAGNLPAVIHKLSIVSIRITHAHFWESPYINSLGSLPNSEVACPTSVIEG